MPVFFLAIVRPNKMLTFRENEEEIVHTLHNFLVALQTVHLKNQQNIVIQELLSGAKQKTVITAITLGTSNFCCSSKVRRGTPTHKYHGFFIVKQFQLHSKENNNYRYTEVFKDQNKKNKKSHENTISMLYHNESSLKELKPKPERSFLSHIFSRSLEYTKNSSHFVTEEFVLANRLEPLTQLQLVFQKKIRNHELVRASLSASYPLWGVL